MSEQWHESVSPSNVIQLPILNRHPSGSELVAEHKFTGPLSGPMWKKVEALKSAYPDEFDYSVFDKLYHRFGENQPRGGIVFKSFMKLLEADDCKSCFHRFEIDTYGRGCVFNCAFCYAKSYLTTHKYWNEPIPFPIDIAELRKTFATVFETDRRHKFRSIMEKRIPLRIGSMSDSFMWIDKKYKVTQELLKILKYYQYPYIIFTRSDLVAEDEYMALLDPGLASVQMSISSINESMTRLIEPGAPSPKRRLAALQKLSEAGFWTTVRVNPLFPNYPDGYYTDPSFDRTKTIKPFDYFSWDIVDAVAEHKVPTLLAGVVRLYEPNVRFMNKALGWDIRETFQPSPKFSRDYIEFSLAEANYYYKKLQQLCLSRGLRFTTCYIGGDTAGASFKFNQYLWSNKSDCCDAKGNVPQIRYTCADIGKAGSKMKVVAKKTDLAHENTNSPSH
jgi:DNA repair photolyase